MIFMGGRHFNRLCRAKRRQPEVRVKVLEVQVKGVGARVKGRDTKTIVGCHCCGCMPARWIELPRRITNVTYMNDTDGPMCSGSYWRTKLLYLQVGGILLAD